MNASKIYSIMAVMMLAFAGLTGSLAMGGSDAVTDDATKLTVTYDGIITPAEASAMFAAGVELSYIAILDDDVEDEITVMNVDDYKAYVKPLIKAGNVVLPLSKIENNVVTISENVTIGYSELMELLAVFTSVEIDKLGEVTGGIQTLVELNVPGQAAKKAVELISAEDAETAIELAVALALADEEAEIQKAVADAVAKYKGYISPADADKLVADAIEDYKAKNPAKDDTYLYCFIVAIAAFLAVLVLFMWMVVVKPRLDKKNKKETAQ